MPWWWPGEVEICSYIQAHAREIWLACVVHDMTLTLIHMPGEQLVNTADVLSLFQIGGVYQDRVHKLMRQGVRIITIPDDVFHLSPDF